LIEMGAMRLPLIHPAENKAGDEARRVTENRGPSVADLAAPYLQ
jgi:hypothetical protein